MTESTKIIENGLVFTCDKQNHAGQLTILIKNGRVSEIGRRADVLKVKYPNAEVIDATGKVLIPGFVDAHHTGESFILRYLTSGQPMSRWNKNPVIQRTLDYLCKEATYEEFLMLYRLSYYAALKSGVTTLADYGIDTPEHSLTAALEVIRQTNVRGFIGLHNGDQIEVARMLRETSVRFAFVIADEENLTTYNLQSTIRLANELQWPIILHLGQTRHAYDVVKKNFNKSIAQLYAEYRVFDSSVQLLHLACFEEGDIEIVAKSGVPLVYSPMAILQKGTDIPPYEKLLKHKIKLALSTDWGAARPLENIQTYCSVLKTLELPVERAYDLLALHTKNGAYALGLDAEIGSIEAGKKADIVFLDLSDFRINSVFANDNIEGILNVVLQEATSQQVSEVMINGEFYVREGHILTYSEDDLANEGKTLLNKLLLISGQKSLEVPSSATILQLPTERNNEGESASNDLPFEEGFRILRKGTQPFVAKKKKDIEQDTPSELPKNVQKLFGDDDE